MLFILHSLPENEICTFGIVTMIIPCLLELIMARATRLQFPTTQIGHPHNLHHQGRPTCEMLRSLTLACFWVKLLPGKSRLFPRVIDCPD